MTLDDAVVDIMNQALWDPHTTTGSDLQARQLAAALGYPNRWRVVRSNEVRNDDDNENDNDNDGDKNNIKNGCFYDRIYSGNPETANCDTWFNHASAMAAAAAWETTDKTQFAFQGGQLLPMQPKFVKGDKVQVLYREEWWDAKILRRQTYPGIFKYQVFYPSDTSKQGGVEEYLIRSRTEEENSESLAGSLGFEEGWKAYGYGKKWKIVSPTGEVFNTKKAALEAAQKLSTESKEIDPELTASTLGFGEGWKADMKGQLWKIVSPWGQVFKSQKSAMDAAEKYTKVDPKITAASLGFEDGWKAYGNGKKWKILSPAGEVFTTKKEALDAAQILSTKSSRELPSPSEIDPEFTASTLGFEAGWKAYGKGRKWEIVAPWGQVFKSRKEAMEKLSGESSTVVASTAEATPEDEGDPPWRTVGNDYLGKRVKLITHHTASSRSTVTIEQMGTVTGWISETDVDKDGKPGFVSESTGEPARLYHIDFDQDEGSAAEEWISEQDLEEWELEQCVEATSEVEVKSVEKDERQSKIPRLK